ncbi:MAG: hypothetical protein KBS95_00510 [Alistipes sp.]|nr:hypothetical protein [Candidatus Alistipes equi]
MVALKKILVASVLFVSTSIACAQELGTKLQEYEKRAEQSMQNVDSLQNVVRSLRTSYQDGTSNRDSIAQLLKRVEKQSYSAIIEKKKTDEELENFLKEHPELKASLHSVAKRSESRTDLAFLTSNAFFKNNLSEKDYKSLLAAEKTEKEISLLLKEIFDRNSAVEDLAKQYDNATEELPADSIYTKYMEQCTLIAKAEQTMNEKWQSVYDNKTYIYSLLMERSRKQSVLDLMEQSAASAREKISKTEGLYLSDAVASYYFFKTGLLSCERRIATEMNFKKAQDSLSAEIKRIQQIDILKNKTEIKKRDFIIYQPIKVIRPQFYTSKNPVPELTEYSSGIIYRIRIGIFTNRPNLSNLRYVTPLSYTKKYHNGKYAYFTGGFKTEEEAQQGVKYLKKLGFRDPKIVMWVDGEYITDLAKWKETNHGYSLEITGIDSICETARKSIMDKYPNAAMSKAGQSYIISGFISKSQVADVEYIVLRNEPKAETKIIKN